MTDTTALVLGATGIAGSGITNHLAQNGWRVVALSRRPLPFRHTQIESIQVDLTDKAALEQALSKHSITHVFSAATIPNRPAMGSSYKSTRALMQATSAFLPVIERVSWLRDSFYQQLAAAASATDPHNTNLAMLRNVFEVTRSVPHRLQHFGLVTGGKVYGMHFGPYLYKGWRSTFREDDPYAPGPNYYYHLENYVRDVIAPTGVSWTIVRPAYVIGVNPFGSFNTLVGLAVYASLLRAKGMPLIFPADGSAADCMTELTDAEQMGRIFAWAANTPSAHNQAFNAANGKAVRWRDVWNQFAACFNMAGEIREQGFDGAGFVRDNARLWDRLVAENRLEPYPLDELLPPGFLNVAFVQNWDTVFSLEKLQHFGFTQTVDPVEMFQRHIETLRTYRVIPY